MATLLESLVISIGLDTKPLEQGAKKSKAQIGDLKKSTESAAKDMAQAGKVAGEFFSKIRNEALALFGVFTAGKGIKDFVSDITAGDAATGRLAKNIGVSVQTLGQWQGASERAGGTAEATGASIYGLSRKFQTLSGQADLIPYFRQLGVTLGDYYDAATGAVDVTGLLVRTSQAVQGMSRPRANAFLSGIGLDQGLSNLLIEGPDAVKRLLAEQTKLGIATEKDAKAAIDFQNALKDLAQPAIEIGRTVETEITPAIVELANEIKAWTLANREWLSASIVSELREMVAGARDFAREANEIVQALGGWKIAGEAFFALWTVGRVAGLLATLNTIRLAILGTVGAATAAGAGAAAGGLAAWIAGGAASVGALFGLGAAAGGLTTRPEDFDTHREPGAGDRAIIGARDATRDWLKSAGQWAWDKLSGLTTRENEAGARLAELGGWSRAQAAGIVANLVTESGLNPHAVGDSGHAFGIAQWHEDRQAEFARVFGHDIRESTLDEQLKFVAYELKQGREKAAGRALDSASDAEAAGAIVSSRYERPADAAGQAAARAALAARIVSRSAFVPTGAAPASGSTSTNTVSIQNQNIYTKATDAQGIARDIGPAMQGGGFGAQAATGVQ